MIQGALSVTRLVLVDLGATELRKLLAALRPLATRLYVVELIRCTCDRLQGITKFLQTSVNNSLEELVLAGLGVKSFGQVPDPTALAAFFRSIATCPRLKEIHLWFRTWDNLWQSVELWAQANEVCARVGKEWLANVIVQDNEDFRVSREKWPENKEAKLTLRTVSATKHKWQGLNVTFARTDLAGVLQVFHQTYQCTDAALDTSVHRLLFNTTLTPAQLEARAPQGSDVARLAKYFRDLRMSAGTTNEDSLNKAVPLLLDVFAEICDQNLFAMTLQIPTKDVYTQRGRKTHPQSADVGIRSTGWDHCLLIIADNKSELKEGYGLPSALVHCANLSTANILKYYPNPAAAAADATNWRVPGVVLSFAGSRCKVGVASFNRNSWNQIRQGIPSTDAEELVYLEVDITTPQGLRDLAKVLITAMNHFKSEMNLVAGNSPILRAPA